MSLDAAFNDAKSRERKQNEVTRSLLFRQAKLRELYAYSALLGAISPLHPHEWVLDGDPTEDEQRFLDANDITQGRYFNDSTLPSPFANVKPSPIPHVLSTPKHSIVVPSLPSTAPQVSGTLDLEQQLKAASSSPSVLDQPLSARETPAPIDRSPQSQLVPKDARSEPSPRRSSRASTPAASRLVTPVANDGEPHAKRRRLTPPAEDRSDGVSPLGELDGPVVDPKKALPVTSDDVAALPRSELPEEETEEEPRPAQVVHLPPKEVQEQRLRETEQNLDKVAEKERKEDEKLNVPNAAADLASSPSSTVGPYSTTTPRQQHHSPDTSPDQDSFGTDIPRAPPELQDPAAQAAKEEHDKELHLRMKEARENARRLSPETPEAQLQLEDEEAIRQARDRARISESVPENRTNALTEHAEEVVQESARSAEELAQEQSFEPVVDSLPTPSTTAPEPLSAVPGQLDTINVIPHQPKLPLNEHPTPPADAEMPDAPAAPSQETGSRPVASHPERMTTRVSSGAIRQKSVSEILRETPAPATLTPKSSLVSISESPVRSRSSGQKDKDKAKVSTVIFAKPNKKSHSKALELFNEDYAGLQGAADDPGRDYLIGLFKWQAHNSPRSTPLPELLASARKTVTTSGTLATLRETQDYRILKRVYQLQNANRWSLRQLQKSAEPQRPVTHMDHLLAEMKWMQTDFKEERKWKRSLAASFANWCAEYVNSTPEQKASLRVRARIPKRPQETDDGMVDAPTPDLISSGAHETESESFDDDDFLPHINGAGLPTGLFSLGYDDVVYKVNRTPASDSMMLELPYYDPTPESLNDLTFSAFQDPPILPVSKLVTGKLVSKTQGAPRRRSRYDYESEDEPDPPPSRSGLSSSDHSMPSTPGRRLNRNDLPPEMTDVALFSYENKHVRDRLQAAHHFRPPSEFLMPSVAFFESRNSSQWLWDEDQKLRTLVKEYTFNWSLIAQELSQPSMFTSSAERRTPWECFERWVQLEGLPAEMSKTQYFRTYQQRLEQAQRTIASQHQATLQQMQQQNIAAGQIPSHLRRRTTQPIRVERRRSNRYLFLIDGMRKLARKKESVAHKQAEALKAAALRKAHEPAPPKSSVHSPQEFSRLKWEREEKMREKSEQYRINMQRQAAANAAAQRQSQGGVPGQPGGLPNGVNPPQRNGTPNSGAHVSTPLSASNSQSGHPANAGMQSRNHPNQASMQGNFPNGNMSGVGMGVNGIPQAQMQANMQNQQRMPPPDSMRLAMQRGQYPSSNQHQFQLQQQQINMASNIASQISNANGIPNANMISSMAGQNMNGNSTPSMNGMSNSAGSPRMNQANPSMQTSSRPLSSGMVPTINHITGQIKAQHPEWSQEQVNKVATAELNKWMLRNRQSAMSAAAGTSPMASNQNQMGSNVYAQNNGMTGNGLGGNSPSPSSLSNYQQQIQQRMLNQSRAQAAQQQQQQAGSPRMGQAQQRPESRSQTPQGQQGGLPRQSPQAQVARN